MRPPLKFATGGTALAILLGIFGWAQTPPVPPLVVSVRISFGLTDTAPSQWDGTVQLDSGSVKAIQGVRFGPE
ncbi:MAG: hypothetical protein M3N54_08870, partial [Acidobacteriota bacterium]|nr:hypothetical protein [Acidobacteriota bacterium]